jgi:hypothetical protein
MALLADEFPHTCENDCPPPEHEVCPHHSCGFYCDDDCFDFICERCSSDWPAPELLLHSKMYKISDKYAVTSLK